MHFIWPLLLAAFFVGAIVSSLHKQPQILGQCLALGAGSLIMTVGMPIARFFSVGRSFNRLFPSGQQDRTSIMEIDDERIVRELAGTSEFKVLWRAIYDFAENERVSLLYTNKDCFLIIPERSMSPDQHAELMALVARHVTKRKP
jgi:hypothetical protein